VTALHRLEAALIPRLRAFADSPEMTAIRLTLPLSFVGLAIGLGAFMLGHPGSLLVRFSASFAAAFGVMSVLLVGLLAGDLARRRHVSRAVAVAIAYGAFAISLPYQQATSPFALATALGSSGLFLAIGIGLGTVSVLRVTSARFGATGGALAAAVAMLGLAGLFPLFGISLTAVLDRLLQPLGTLGDSLTALLIITLVETLLWTIGIHGPALLAAVVLPVYIRLQTENTNAMAHGDPLPHIVTVSTFLFIFPGGAGATLPLVVMLLRSKVKRVRTVAYATLLPSIFNANEPLMFGLPVVLNPVLGIPFVVTPLVLALVTYGAMAANWVDRPALYIPSTIPLPLAVFFASKDWRAVVLSLVNLAIAFAIWAPFVAAYERVERKGEKAVAA
jgi:PTS system cellobiose-specific IIC component